MRIQGCYAINTEVELQYYGVDTTSTVVEETMGTEIEAEARTDYAVYDLVQEINDIFNKEKENLICVRDGSLDQEIGFEMVSTNATFDYHKNHFWNEFFKSDIPTKKLRAFQRLTNCYSYSLFKKRIYYSSIKAFKRILS
jgi:hypothetical protein